MGEAFARMSDHSMQLLILSALSLVPLVIVLALGLAPRGQEKMRNWRVGNPLHTAVLPVVRPAFVEPLVSQLRGMHGSEMNGYAVGLRHLPVEAAAPVLRYLQHCADPAVELYAQTVLQGGKDVLQSLCGRLQESSATCSQRGMCALLEVGLRLAHPALLPSSEKASWISRMEANAEQALARFSQPSVRLLAAMARVFMAARRLEHAAALIQRLPANSPVKQELSQAFAFASRQLPVLDS